MNHFGETGSHELMARLTNDLNGRNRRESLYAQDSWHIGDRLTFNPGVRSSSRRISHT